jgi:hypothetical protein
MSFDYTYTPREQLCIAQEGIGDLIAAGTLAAQNVKEKLMEVFPTLLSGFSGRDKLEKIPDATMYGKERKDFLKHVAHTSYADTRELRAYVPEGLSVGYLDYGKTLLTASEHLKGIVGNTVNPFALFLTHLIGSQGKVLSATSHAIEHNRVETNRSEIYKSLNSCFANSKYEVETTIGSVVHRNSDWDEIFKDLDATLKNLQGIDRDKIRELTKQCDASMEILFKLLGEGNLDGITAEVGEDLTRGAFQVAQELELLSIVYYRALAYDQAIVRTVAKVNEILE